MSMCELHGQMCWVGSSDTLTNIDLVRDAYTVLAKQVHIKK